jgi:TonB-dependent receptor
MSYVTRDKFIGGNMRTCSKAIVVLISVFLITGADMLFAQSSGSVTGRVLNAESGRALIGANVVLEGTSYGSATSQSGTYRLQQIPAGDYTLIVRYIGFEEKRESITITAGQSLELDFRLNPAFLEGDDVVVTARAEGQVRALNLQRSSEMIRNVVSAEQLEQFADPNLAGALSRVPGLSYQTDRGEAGEVYIRGLSPSLSSVTVNGAQLASTDTDGREVWMGGMTADLVTNLEVVKAITPDMNANTISGSINLDTHQSIGDSPIVRANASGGISQLSDGGQVQAGLQYGQRFGNFQYFITGSYQSNNRETHDMRKEYGDFDFGDGTDSFRNVLEEQRLSTYAIPRKRYGFTAQFDYDFNRNNSIYFRTLFNEFDDSQTRDQHRIELDRNDYISRTEAPGARFQVDSRIYERKLSSYSAVLGGASQISDWGIEYRGAYSRGTYREPFRDYFRFRHSGGVDVRYEDLSEFYFPQVWVTDGTDVSNSNNYGLTYFQLETEDATDNDYSANLDITRPLTLGNARVDLKFGGLYRHRIKDQFHTSDRYDYNGVFTLGRIATPDNRLYLSRYNKFAPNVDWSKARGIFDRERNLFELDEERSYEEGTFYEVKENDLAAYLMGTFNFDRFTLVAGVRYENIDGTYTGSLKELRFNEDGDPIFGAEQIIEESNSYSNFFPMVHLRYSLSESTNLRFAYTQTYARPLFGQLAPNQFINEDDEEIILGNPALEPLKSTNLDFMLEYYFSSVGVLSGGFFYKKIDDFIFNQAREIDSGEFTGWVERQPVNGDAATVYGFEMAWQQQLRFLPGVLSGLGVYANYSYTFSEAEITGLEERTVRLPEQVPHVFNAALSFTSGGFFAQLSANYQDDWLDEIASNPADDRWRAKTLTFDASASQRLTSALTAFVDVHNITNQGTGEFYGARSNQYHRGRSKDFHGWWANLGVRFRL